MGDKKSASVAQLFHLILLRTGGLIAPIMAYGQPIPSAPVVIGVVVNDLGVIAEQLRSRPSQCRHVELPGRFAAALQSSDRCHCMLDIISNPDSLSNTYM